MNKKIIERFKNEPVPYQAGEKEFWNDEHISKSMLHNHLAPDIDGASRRRSQIEQSVSWITSLKAPGDRLLDLGCGPGIYAELFCEKGFHVQGIDFSRRSIEHAIDSAKRQGKRIDYRYQDYLEIEYCDVFDIVTLIYCDFGVLPPQDRKCLLEKIYSALKPGGIFVMDVFSENQYRNFEDALKVTYEEGGFWSPEPYLCIKKDKRYEEHVFLEQYVVISEQAVKTYNLWNHAFSQSELEGDLTGIRFGNIDFYNDVTGKEYDGTAPTICITARK